MVLWYAENLKIAKSFDPCQPARIAQADMGRYFSQMHEHPLPPSSQSTDQLYNMHISNLQEELSFVTLTIWE